jgi:tetratricopeptide (TPR) repeat protein
MRRYDEALHDFERTLKLTQNDAHAYGLRGLVWAKKGDCSRALADFDEAIRLAPQNAELYRSHRDRVLAESSRAPIEGGDFSILKNPFVLLGLPPTAAPAMVKEAQQTFLTPRLRIEAEVGGFIDIDPRLASQIVSDIRSGAPIDEISEQLTKLHSLPRSNVIAHYGSAQSLEMDSLCDLIAAQAAVTPGAVCDAINDVREEIALGRVDRESVSEALSKLLDRQTKAVIERLGYSSGATDLFEHFVSKIIAGADSPTLFRLDVYVRTFAQIVAPELSKRAESVATACEEIKKRPKSQSSRDKLSAALEGWISLLRPIQTYETHRQREDTTTREMYVKVRDLALWLANEKKEFESAGQVVEIASGVFGHLPRAAAQMKEEAAQLVGLRNEQLAEELLTPLLQACEASNTSHRTIESELLRAGFGPGSTGSMKALFDKFATAVGSTAKLAFADAPWRLVRDVAISLNNDSSAPRAAENLIQGILDFADRHPPTAEMIGTLREDHRIVRKNQVEADLGKSLQAQKWGEAEKLVERLLTLETDDENLKSTRQIRETVSAKHKAVVRTRWFWGIAAAGVLIWIVASNDNNKSATTNYRPPPPSYSTTTTSPTTTTRNDAFVPVDTSEAIPPVGSGLSLSRSNIRYCSYQGIRLEAARSAITTESQRRGFNTGIDDYNSRCSRYQYLQSDKNAVDAELPGRRYALDTEGRALAAIWQSNSLPKPRVNR